MRVRWLAVIGVLFAAGAAGAQPARGFSAFEAAQPPADLPLVPVPGPRPPPAPFAPGGPVAEYEQGYFYLPERAPERDRPEPPCGPPGRVWFSSEVALADTPDARARGLRMNPGTRTGLILNGGLWLDPGHTSGFDAGFFHLGQGDVSGFGGDYTVQFDTADVNYRRRLLCGDLFSLDGLAGYRYGRVAEEVGVFRRDVNTVNQFHGGQVGLSSEMGIGPWYVAATGTAAFGVLYADTTLSTLRRTTSREDSRYAVMPTAAVQLGRAVGEHGRLYVGYQFVGLTRVTRAAEPCGTSDFWAQGVTLGLELRY